MSTIEGTPTPPPPSDAAEEPRKLRRSRSNRWIAGVSGGLAEYFGLNAAVYRVLFVALAFAGGTGILLYLAALLVMPDEGEDEAILSGALSRHRDRPWHVIGLALLALLLISIVSDFDLDPGAPIFAVFVLAIVLLIAWGARGGKLRMAVALTFVAALFVVPIAGGLVFANAHGGIGEETSRPMVVGELKDRYELGAGDLVLDLRDVALPPRETRVDLRVGVGEIEVIVPRDVPVSARGEVGWGEVSVLGDDAEGRDLERSVVERGFHEAKTRIVIDARLRAGDLNIHR